MPYFDFAVIGGDKRSTYMIPILRNLGYRVISYKTVEDTKSEQNAGSGAKKAESLKEAVACAGALILGVPVCRKGYLNLEGNVTVKDLVELMKPDQYLYGGAISVQERDVFLQKTKYVYDFLAEEKISICNAAATAEGVLLEVLKQEENVLTGRKILLFGFGRCGKNIAMRLRGLYADVVVATDRVEERAWASSLGFETSSLKEAKKRIKTVHVIINTIPVCFLEKKDVVGLRSKINLYEVASRSCLFNEETFKDTSLQIIYLPGLPGKYKAKSLAEVYTEYICETWRGE